MENDIYKMLYYHAFSRLSDLKCEIEKIQLDLEESYLDLLEHADIFEYTEDDEAAPRLEAYRDE